MVIGRFLAEFTVLAMLMLIQFPSLLPSIVFPLGVSVARVVVRAEFATVKTTFTAISTD